MDNLVPIERIESNILTIRGQKVMLDKDLAELYGVSTFRLNEQVKRNIERFPEDFMFQLTKEEWQNLKSQNAISSWGGRRTAPFAFTEYGVAMLSSVLKSKRAIQVNIAIMRTFGKLRQILSTHKELAQKLEQLERQVGSNTKDIRNIFQTIRQLMGGQETKQKKIGFLKEEGGNTR